jgi:hypothetical protein
MGRGGQTDGQGNFNWLSASPQNTKNRQINNKNKNNNNNNNNN